MNKTFLQFGIWLLNPTAPVTTLAAITFMAGALALPAVPAWADQALVVGINKYSHLGTKHELKGAVNDSTAMQKALQQNGFSVTLLQDGAATKSGIVAAFGDIAAKIKPGERFVFYFAGHGNDTPRCLVPSDATDATPTAAVGNIITKDELKSLVANVPGASRVVILDACFSGGLISKEITMGSSHRTRFAGLGRNTGGKSLPQMGSSHVNLFAADPAPAAVLPKTPSSSPKTDTATNIVYVAAALEKEPAREGNYPDKPDGIPAGTFTHYLLLHTSPAATKKETLGQVIDDVREKVIDDTVDMQRPQFSSDFKDTSLFGTISSTGLAGAPFALPSSVLENTAKADTVWGVYTKDAENPDVVQLTHSPDTTTLQQGSIVTVKVTVKRDGYVVLLNRDQKNRLTLLFPETAEKGQHIAGQETEFDLAAQDLGAERIKLIQFFDKADAEAVIAAFAKVGTQGVDFNAAKSMPAIATRTRNGLSKYVTSQVIFQILPASTIPTVGAGTAKISETKP